MNIQKTLSVLFAVSLASLASNVHAAAYAVSYNNITNLAVTSSDPDGNGAPFYIPLGAFTDFTAFSSATATLDGTVDPANPNNSDAAGGPVDADPAFGLGSVWPGAVQPANNDMTPLGQDGNYARGDAQVGSTALLQAGIGDAVTPSGTLTQAWNVAEGYVAADGDAVASAINGSNTGFTTTITVPGPTILYFNFDADPYLEVAQSADSAGGTANANIDVTFTVSRNNGDGSSESVFVWSPNGEEGGIRGGDETLDEADLNRSIEVTTTGTAGVFDPTGDGSAGDITAGGASFAAKTDVLSAGIYD